MLFHCIVVFLLENGTYLIEILILHVDLVVGQVGIMFVVSLIASDFVVNVALNSLAICLSFDIVHALFVLVFILKLPLFELLSCGCKHRLQSDIVLIFLFSSLIQVESSFSLLPVVAILLLFEAALLLRLVVWPPLFVLCLCHRNSCVNLSPPNYVPALSLCTGSLVRLSTHRAFSFLRVLSPPVSTSLLSSSRTRYYFKPASYLSSDRSACLNSF